jgi:hypothetical protein
MKIIEQFFFLPLMLWCREIQIGKKFDQQLSIEIDCLQFLIDGAKLKNEL